MVNLVQVFNVMRLICCINILLNLHSVDCWFQMTSIMMLTFFIEEMIALDIKYKRKMKK